MSIKFNRSKASKCETNRVLKIMVIYNDDPYWDEGLNFYPKNRKGYKNPNKRILSYQVRMYKTWKHNRKTQWK